MDKIKKWLKQVLCSHSNFNVNYKFNSYTDTFCGDCWKLLKITHNG